jgi:hypothetical protein
MKITKRTWSNLDARSLLHGEFHHHYGQRFHAYEKSDWYVWFFGNPTKYAIFFLFLHKYGKGEMVSYTDLTQTKKIGQVSLKIDSIKSTIREALEAGFIRSFKSDDDKRVTLYDLNPDIVGEIADYCFSMRRNRMIEASKFIHADTTLKINTELGEAIRSNGDEIIEAISSTVKYANGAIERAEKVTPISQKKS